MLDLDRAKSLLEGSDLTCVLCRGQQTYTSTLRGVAPMLAFLTDGTDLRGFSAADKVVGKAAAMLFALAGVQAVYAPVMSLAALDTLERFHITAHCGQVVPGIINRTQTGPCPMERAVQNLDTPHEALDAIRQTLAVLQRGADA